VKTGAQLTAMVWLGIWDDGRLANQRTTIFRLFGGEDGSTFYFVVSLLFDESCRHHAAI
jgi:hypothetical protein